MINCLGQNETWAMTIEQTIVHSLSKPWGVADPRPWSSVDRDGNLIGEVWYERSSLSDAAPALLLKLLFTDQPLSIQVHPDDAYARLIGLPNGKTEAWYVLGATPQAKVALGLKQRLTSGQLRQAVDDGSIADQVVWQKARVGDTVFVPAGTIHAIGAGLVIVEIQQRSDATFRLYDHDMGRELHIDNAIAVADAGPAAIQIAPSRLTDSRTVLTSNSLFTFEKLDLAPSSTWRLEANRETWLFVVSGSARAGSLTIAKGDAVFAQADRIDMRTGAAGLSGLLAYTGGLIPELMQSADMETIQ
jgi:mannose-6-phosphate isomerase